MEIISTPTLSGCHEVAPNNSCIFVDCKNKVDKDCTICGRHFDMYTKYMYENDESPEWEVQDYSDQSVTRSHKQGEIEIVRGYWWDRLKCRERYKNGQRDGVQYYYDDSTDTIMRKEWWKKGKFIRAQDIDVFRGKIENSAYVPTGYFRYYR